MVSLPIPGQSRWRFPDPATAGEDGLVGIGADLEPATLVDAYRQGIKILESLQADPATASPTDVPPLAQLCNQLGRLIHCTARDGEAEAAADGRQQHRLGEQLSHDARAAGAEHHADRQLLLSRLRSRQQQIGDVGAGDGENAHHRADQDP